MTLRAHWWAVLVALFGFQAVAHAQFTGGGAGGSVACSTATSTTAGCIKPDGTTVKVDPSTGTASVPMVSTSGPGLAPTLSGSTSTFLRSDGTQATPPSATPANNTTPGIVGAPSTPTVMSVASGVIDAPLINQQFDSLNNSMCSAIGAGASMRGVISTTGLQAYGLVFGGGTNSLGLSQTQRTLNQTLLQAAINCASANGEFLEPPPHAIEMYGATPLTIPVGGKNFWRGSRGSQLVQFNCAIPILVVGDATAQQQSYRNTKVEGASLSYPGRVQNANFTGSIAAGGSSLAVGTISTVANTAGIASDITAGQAVSYAGSPTGLVIMSGPAVSDGTYALGLTLPSTTFTGPGGTLVGTVSNNLLAVTGGTGTVTAGQALTYPGSSGFTVSLPSAFANGGVYGLGSTYTGTNSGVINFTSSSGAFTGYIYQGNIYVQSITSGTVSAGQTLTLSQSVYANGGNTTTLTVPSTLAAGATYTLSAKSTAAVASVAITATQTGQYCTSGQTGAQGLVIGPAYEQIIGDIGVAVPYYLVDGLYGSAPPYIGVNLPYATSAVAWFQNHMHDIEVFGSQYSLFVNAQTGTPSELFNIYLAAGANAGGDLLTSRTILLGDAARFGSLGYDGVTNLTPGDGGYHGTSGSIDLFHIEGTAAPNLLHIILPGGMSINRLHEEGVDITGNNGALIKQEGGEVRMTSSDSLEAATVGAAGGSLSYNGTTTATIATVPTFGTFAQGNTVTSSSIPYYNNIGITSASCQTVGCTVTLSGTSGVPGSAGSPVVQATTTYASGAGIYNISGINEICDINHFTLNWQFQTSFMLPKTPFMFASFSGDQFAPTSCHAEDVRVVDSYNQVAPNLALDPINASNYPPTDGMPAGSIIPAYKWHWAQSETTGYQIPLFGSGNPTSYDHFGHHHAARYLVNNTLTGVSTVNLHTTSKSTNAYPSAGAGLPAKVGDTVEINVAANGTSPYALVVNSVVGTSGAVTQIISTTTTGTTLWFYFNGTAWVQFT